MRTVLVFAFSFFWGAGFCQNSDSLAAAAQVDSLIKISRDLTGKKDFEKALEVNAAAEKIALERFGRESAAYGSVCSNCGYLFHSKGDKLGAEKWYLESKAIREKAMGKEHPQYVGSLTNLALLYRDMGEFAKAEHYFLENKEIQAKTTGKETPGYAGNLINLGNLYSKMGRYGDAELLFLEAKAIFEDKLKDRTHPFYISCLTGLAILYNDTDRFGEAEPLYLNIKLSHEKKFGIENPTYAGSLINLAVLYDKMGRFDEAEPLYLEAKMIFEDKLNNRTHTFYMNCLGNLASMYRKQLNYEKAEPFNLEAKAIRGKALGKGHPDYIESLTNLANLYWEMGRYKKAEPLYIEVRDILETTHGKTHLYYAQNLNNLANLYVNMNHYEKAKPLILEAIDIFQKFIGNEHPDYAESLSILAIFFKKTANYEKAEPLYLEAKAIREKNFGKEHPNYAGTLINLASLYSNMDNYAKAEPLFYEAKYIFEVRLNNREHPFYITCLNNLTNLHEKQHQYSSADSLAAECSSLQQAKLLKAVRFLSQQELADYTTIFKAEGDNLSARIIARLQGDVQTKSPPVEVFQAGIHGLIFEHTLFHKGFLLAAAARLNTLAASKPESDEINLRLKSYCRRLAAEYAKPIAERKSVTELEEKANIAEKELARTVAGYADAIRQVKWQEVQSALKQAEAAIEFVHFRANFPKKTDSTMYAALVLLPGTDQPKFIPLFEEKPLDSLLQTQGERRADYVNQLYTLVERGAKPLGKPQKTLYELLWKPLETHLKGVTTVYFSPSGLLHRLNLAAIPVSIDSVLADRYNLVELGSTRQLVIPSTVTSATNDAVLFGGIRYNADSTAMTQANAGLDSISIASRGLSRSIGSDLSFTYTDSTLRLGTWSALPFTDREVNSVEKTLKSAGFQSEARRGFTATEEAFKTIGVGRKPSPRVLHVATHGFFFPDPKNSPSPLERGLGGEAEPVFKMSDHPMIRSGLLLAGANHAWATGKPLREGMEDGILTAYEISQMNLSNTELVVLSACETGLGDIQGNEGVYGLQRAFKIAGAKYLLMSLWQVDDQATMKFMEVFYRKWLEGNMQIPDAFRATQAEMRERFLNPYLWAGFVLVE